MPRVKRGKVRARKRARVLKRTKGMMWGRKSKIKLAKTAATKAGAYAYRDRRNKKRAMRSLWLVRLNAGLHEQGLSYSKFSGMLTKANIKLDRKVLADLAANHPAVFKALVETVSKMSSK
ncbi:MAG TPA: 50S ribosomal protein L20 [Candidatus Baltobacteraceae bacterium]|jgi:large subunit ribosomal protein L20|nr:50S ribosomal protein L20 [Candidatus Baltobacteraceae bacterium]